jgi:hypothetical protein
MGVLKIGTIGLDGTKIHANASRHSALSYEHTGKIEAQLKAEVADLMAKAEAADAADIPDACRFRRTGAAGGAFTQDRRSACEDRSARQGTPCARAGGA